MARRPKPGTAAGDITGRENDPPPTARAGLELGDLFSPDSPAFVWATYDEQGVGKFGLTEQEAVGATLTHCGIDALPDTTKTARVPLADARSYMRRRGPTFEGTDIDGDDEGVILRLLFAPE